jgi:branched-chain amino acid transport system permease protein
LAAQAGTAVPRNFAPVGSLLVFALATFTGAEYALGALIAGILSAFTPELLARLNIPADVAQMVFALGAIQALSSGRSIAAGIMRPRGKVEHHVAIDDTGGRALTVVAAAGDRPALEVQGLRVTYGSVVALDAVSFTVPHRSVTALIGPNGAGKSTLVDAVTGFIERAEGSVRVAGRSLDGCDARKRARSGIRRTFQQGATIPELSIAGYLSLAAQRHLTRAEIEEVAGFFGLGSPDSPISLIDVGTRRVVEVAGTVVARPEVVLLDEPAAGLPSTESLALAHRVAAIPGRFGCTVVVIEHDLEFVRAACQQIVALDFGKVIARGDCSTVLTSPAVVEAYIGPSAEVAI